jgi:Ca2+-binding RTX toxin-like protein
MSQYSIDASLASSATDAQLQSILSYLNPSIGTVSTTALNEFQQQLEALTPTGSGDAYVTNATLDPSSTAYTPLFDIAATGAPNTEVSAGPGFDTISGTSGDTLDGSTSPTGGALLIAGGGPEQLYAGAGSDTLNAGSGSDTIYGGTGHDKLVGSSSRTGHALIYGGSGPDSIQAGSGSDTIYAGSGDDTIKAGTGNSTVYAGSGHDTVYGGAAQTTFVVTAATFNSGQFIAGAGTNILDLADLTAKDVTVATTAQGTTVTFGDQTLTLKGHVTINYASGNPPS